MDRDAEREEEEAEVNKLPGNKDRWMQLLQQHMCKQYEGVKSGGPKKNKKKQNANRKMYSGPGRF